MKLRESKQLLTLSLFLGVTGCLHAGVLYDLSGDFSNSNNPNGVWSFKVSSTLLGHFFDVSGNPADAVLANGYWGTGNSLNVNTPDVMKVTGNGSAAGEADSDFLTGDVLAHSPNDGSSVLIIWTAPGDGTIDYSSAIWYAHSSVTRSNDFSLILGSTTLDSGTITPSSFGNRSSAKTSGGTGLAVTAGEQLYFDLRKTSGQPFGSLDGLALSVDFTSSVPEPGTWVLLASGLGLAALRRRR